MKVQHRPLQCLAVVVCLMLAPGWAWAQCMVVNTTSTTNGPTYIEVMKTLNGTYQCNFVTSNNASQCAPMVLIARMTLTASAATTAISPSCEFSCTGGAACASITIDSSDGLPVELLQFDVSDAD